MNKLLLFPLATMFIMTLFAAIYTGDSYIGSTGDYSESGEITYTEDGIPVTANVTIPVAGTQEFNISEASYILIILTVAISIGIIAGIRILGSGLSEMSQSMIYNAILFLGLWAVLSIVSAQLLMDTEIARALWLIISIIYVIGLGIHMTNTNSVG